MELDANLPPANTQALLEACRLMVVAAKAVVYGPAVTSIERNNLGKALTAIERVMHPELQPCVHPFLEREHADSEYLEDGRERVQYRCGICGVWTNSIYPAGWDL